MPRITPVPTRSAPARAVPSYCWAAQSFSFARAPARGRASITPAPRSHFKKTEMDSQEVSGTSQQEGDASPRPLTPAQRIAARDWCFTIFPPQPAVLLDLPAEQAKITEWPYRYIVYQVEECPTTHREHLQGFVQFTDKQRLSALKKFHPTAHWDKRLGTPYEAQHYCMKPVPDCDCQHCADLERYDDRIFEDGFMSVETQHKVHEVPAYLFHNHRGFLCITTGYGAPPVNLSSDH